MGDQANETTTHEPLAVSHNYNDNTNHTTNNSHNEVKQTKQQLTCHSGRSPPTQ